MNICQALSELIENEGGYVNDSDDKGGPTKYGITERVARAHGYTGDMKDLPVDTAAAIYKADYWTAPHFDQVNELHPDLGFRLFDFGVNCGQTTSAETLQTALNALSGTVQAVDGQIGPRTIEALKSVLKHTNGAVVLLGVVRALMLLHYLKIVEKDEKQSKFLFGWLDRCLR